MVPKEKSLSLRIDRSSQAAAMKWRKDLLARAKESRQLQHDLTSQCADDPLFFINAFLFTFNPRKPVKDLCFMTWEFQDGFIYDVIDAIRSDKPHDLHIDKSRDMGASWCILAIFLWLWLFHPNSLLLLVSRSEDLVDMSGNPDCLFWKIDYMISWLPEWMIPKHTRTKLVLQNHKNGSVINGESTNQNIGRGGRRLAIFCDEFPAVEPPHALRTLSATADTAPCRLFVGTPCGMGHPFATMKFSNKVKQISLHWTLHPEKRRGLYRMKDGQLEIIDKTYVFPPDYVFRESSGKLRSVWYDHECDRRTTSQEIAQEIDIDYLSSGLVVFDNDIIARHKAEHCKDPIAVGELHFSRFASGESYRVKLKPTDPHEPSTAFVPNSGRRRLQIWAIPNPDHNYVVTADISQGQGASNSVLCVADRHTRAKVAQFVCPDTMPHDLAVVAVALAKFYRSQRGDAFVMWEANGPGMVFGKELIRLGHGFFYIQRNEQDITHKTSKTPGWHSSTVNKELLLTDYREALKRNDIIIPSKDSLDESLTYVFYDTGGCGPSALATEGNGARSAHGDRVIADALLVFALREVAKFKQKEEDVPAYSYEWSRRRSRVKQTNNGW